ncbi:MAG: hypothetical protein GF344_11420 [Chitinivibrionales bacterium]|nr:hypothetical protein [Chitinivibrionales bacterium]MBD3357410.1 hypothetical protein [Chitinivibrionales bacterium]
MKRTSAVVALVLTSGLSLQAMPLGNWRRPFADITAERGELISSPSRLFWDDIGPGGVFTYRLWPSVTPGPRYQWTFEPSLSLSYDSEEYPHDQHTNVKFDALSDFVFGPFSVRTVLDVEQQYQDHADYVWHTDRGAAGRIEEAYVQYSGKYGFARLGRLNRNWGPFVDRSILLSDNPFTYDAFEWRFHVPFLEFRHLFAAFPLTHSNVDIGGSRHRCRYFTAHALNFILGDWGSIGVSETVLFSRDKGFPDLQYINPVGIYSVINTNHEGAGNLMLGFQGWAHPFTKSVILRGQVVLDDFQVDNESKGDQEPMHWACDVGAVWKDPLPLNRIHHFTVDYRYLSKWMYTVSRPNTLKGERYTYLGRGLGYPRVDGDELRAMVTVVGDNYWAASAGISFARQDTNTIWTSWDKPDSSSHSLGYRKEDPLSQRSNISTVVSVPIEAHAYIRDFVAFHLKIDNRWIENGDHTGSTGFAYDPRVAFTVTGHYNFSVNFERKKE